MKRLQGSTREVFMKTIVLEGTKFSSVEALHITLKEELNLSDHYGENLDALWDELSVRSEATEIVVMDWLKAKLLLGSYADKLERVFTEIGQCNKGISVKFK